MEKRLRKPTVAGKPKAPKKAPKIYMIKGIAYHYKSGRLVKVPIGKAKTKKKKEGWTL